MASVKQFFDEHVKIALRRGNSMDDALPGALRSAIRFIENNFDLHYMKRTEIYTTVPGVREFTFSGGIGQSIKNVLEVKSPVPDGWLSYRKMEEWEQPKAWSGVGGFWLETVPEQQGGVTWRFRFNTAFTEPVDIHFVLMRYTMWGGSLDDRSIWLVNNAPGLLTARMMLVLAPIMRDPQIMSMWQVNYREELSALLNREDTILRGAA